MSIQSFRVRLYGSGGLNDPIAAYELPCLPSDAPEQVFYDGKWYTLGSIEKRPNGFHYYHLRHGGERDPGMRFYRINHDVDRAIPWDDEPATGLDRDPPKSSHGVKQVRLVSDGVKTYLFDADGNDMLPTLMAKELTVTIKGQELTELTIKIDLAAVDVRGNVGSA